MGGKGGSDPGRSLKTVGHITPTAVVVIAILLGLAAVTAAADDERLGVVDSHCEVVEYCRGMRCLARFFDRKMRLLT